MFEKKNQFYALWISQENDKRKNNKNENEDEDQQQQQQQQKEIHALKGAIEVCLLHFAYIIYNIINILNGVWDEKFI